MVTMAVEVGGTFTDLIWMDENGGVRTHKVASTPSDPSEGVLNGLTEALGEGMSTIGWLLHGSTVATNAVLERKGCRAGLITTRGFRDLLVTQRQLRSDIYSVVCKKPEPLIPLSRTGEAVERMSVSGEEMVPLDAEGLIASVEELIREEDLEALAISFLHSYGNPAHEEQARAVLADTFPDLPVLISSQVLPTFREYERTSTTAIAAYLVPLLDRYLSHLERYLAEHSVDVPLFIMQSSGGVLPSHAIRSRPVEMLQSGPAAGVIGAASVAEKLGDLDIITLDVGGTSSDVCLVSGGVAEVSAERELGGLPIGIPSVDIVNVGAGGGSLGWLDRGGMLRVGPQSAGAYPGPACYGNGGAEPTLTDALVQLDWIRPDHFLGGRMALHPELATGVLARLAGLLGLQVNATAQSMVDVAVANINSAVRLVSVQRGYDPQSYVLYAYGGMGPAIGALVAEEMNIPKVVVPPHPGLFSALGLLVADLKRTYRQTEFMLVGDGSSDRVVQAFGRLRVEAEAEFARYGYPSDQLRMDTWLEMRYKGQGFELLVPVELERVQKEGREYLVSLFHQSHRARYDTSAPNDAIEVVTYRLVAQVPGRREVLDRLHDQVRGSEPATAFSEVSFRGRQEVCRFVRRDSLPLGYSIRGLAIVEEPTATTVVPPGWKAQVGDTGALILAREVAE